MTVPTATATTAVPVPAQATNTPATVITARATSPRRPTRRTHRLAPPDESGQTTAEYALLTGAIALVVAAVTAWATSTGKIGRLLDSVFNYLVKAVS